MFRGIEVEKFYEICTKTEYDQSIKYKYKVRPLLKSYFKKMSDFGSDEKGLGLVGHLDHLREVYTEIVRPMIA